MVIAAEVVSAVGLVRQFAELLSTTLTCCPLVRLVILKILEVPVWAALEPDPIYQAYEGLGPPLVLVAVKVISSPGQAVCLETLTDTVGVFRGFTVIVRVLSLVFVQESTVEVTVRLILSPLLRLELVKVLEAVGPPELLPLIFHWY